MFKDKEPCVCLFFFKRCCIFSQTTYPRKRLREGILLLFYSVLRKKKKNKFTLGKPPVFYVISRPICHISQSLRGLVQVNIFLKCPLELILPGHGMWFFPCVLVSGYSLQNVSNIICFTSWKKLCCHWYIHRALACYLQKRH